MAVKKEQIGEVVRVSIESEVPQEKLDEVQWVDISKIKEHPSNKEIYSSGRKVEDEELEENIKLYGLLQPIIVDKKTNYIISGNRRFQACSNLGLKKVKVIKSSLRSTWVMARWWGKMGL